MTAKALKDARDRALAEGKGGGLLHTYLVEAGAGTGKTRVLVDHFLSILAGGADIARVVAITFTEKAAGELKVRLRTELERRVREGEQALAGPLLRLDRAVIGTIHSFCGTLLRESPVEARVDPGFAVADELTRTMLLSRTWDAWLEEELSKGLPPALGEARSLGFTIERARELAGLLIGNHDIIEHAPGPTPEADVEGFLSEIERAAVEFVRLAGEHCREAGDSGCAAIAAFADTVSAAAYLSGDARAAYVLKSVKPAPGSRRGNRNNWDAEVLRSLRERAAALRERQAELARAASHNAAVALVGWLRGFVDRYEAEKAAAGVLDFDDLLLKARDLLRGNPEARDRWKAAYDRILVDEFQDTDPLQCEVVFFLSEKRGVSAASWDEVALEPGKLFIVGDPKQSIYRFRRADIEMYDHAKSVAGGALHLVENFRTRPSLVAEVNESFRGVMAAPADGRRYQPEYEALEPFRDADAEGPGLLFLMPAEDGVEWAHVDEARAAEARAVAAFLAHLRDTGAVRVWEKEEDEWRPATLGDVAILFRRTMALPHYEEALSAYDIDYRVAGGKRFYTRREVTELAAVLEAVDDPHNLVSVVGTLRSPFLGVSDDNILLHRARAGSLNYLDGRAGVRDVERAFALLAGLHRSRNERAVPDVIREVFERTGVLELYLMKPDGEQRHANLEKVVELAEALGRKEPLSLGGFVRWLRGVSELTPEEAESPLSEEGGDFVRLLTIHKAKGLEFPVTVLADLSASDAKKDAMVVDREEGRLEFQIGGGNGGLETEGYDGLWELEKDRKRAESLRLLYVGMTRARDALVVPWFTKKAEPSGLLTYLAGARERAAEPVRSLDAVRGRAVAAFDAGALDLDRAPKKPLRIDVAKAAESDVTITRAFAERTQWQARRSALVAEHHRPPRISTPSGREAWPPGGQPRGVPGIGAGDRESRIELGNLVHAVMERLDFAHPEGADAIARAIARTRGIPDAAAGRAADLARRALKSAVMRRALAAERLFREVPFCASSPQGLVEGRADLVFEDAGGVVIVDYKTDALGGEGPTAIAERYRGQAEEYAKAFSAVIGKPVAEVVLLFLAGPDEVRMLGP